MNITHLNDARTRSANQPGYPAEIRGFDGVQRVLAHRWLQCTLDAAGLVTGYVNPGTPLIGFRHAWNAADSKLSQELMHATGDSEGYKYDSAYRLIKFERGTLNAALTEITTLTTTPSLLQRQTFTLDGPGNWPSNVTTTGGTPTTENRTHNNLNQITAINAAPLTYDSNGNTTDDRDYLFAWDAKNRLRRVTRKSDNVVVGIYANDAFDRRIRRVYIVGADPAKTVHYYLDSQRVIEEREVEGTPPAEVFKRQYTYGPYIDECLTLDRDLNANGIATDSGERLFYHANSLYSVFGLSDSSRNFAERYLYDAYGRPIVWLTGPDATYGTGDDIRTANGSSTVQNVRLFTSREWESESLLYYFRARYQSPGLGRFLSRDPLLYRDGENLYLYTRNSPAIRTDPAGHMSEGGPYIGLAAGAAYAGCVLGFYFYALDTYGGVKPEEWLHCYTTCKISSWCVLGAGAALFVGLTNESWEVIIDKVEEWFPGTIPAGWSHHDIQELVQDMIDNSYGALCSKIPLTYRVSCKCCCDYLKAENLLL